MTVIPIRELQVGDIIRLGTMDSAPFMDAKVVDIKDHKATIWRPWMMVDPDSKGYPYIGMEVVYLYTDSDSPVKLMQRRS